MLYFVVSGNCCNLVHEFNVCPREGIIIAKIRIHIT